MKPYTAEIEIGLPRDQVIALFDDAENLFKWQAGLQSFDPVSGSPGQPGAKSKMVYLNGKQRIELVETVTRRDLPDAFDGHYAWSGGENTLHNRFIAVDAQTTRWESTCTYRFHSPFLKLMGIFLPGMFRKQNMKFLENFKAFCEDGHDVRQAT